MTSTALPSSWSRIDGALQDASTGPAGFDMTSDEAPRIGRNVVYNPAYHTGSVDDVRVFRRALPCASASR